MTLLDAPKFDEKRERRKKYLMIGSAVFVLAVIASGWLVAGRPLDWPWNWYTHLRGRMEVNSFFKDVEKNDLQAAYALWFQDKNWQQHPEAHPTYDFERFRRDWAPDGVENDYGAIRSHRIAATHMRGNVLMLGIFVNGRTTKAINLIYDPHDHTLSFTPDNVQFLEGPGGIQ